MTGKGSPNTARVQVIADTHGAWVDVNETVDGWFVLGDADGAWTFDLETTSKRTGKPVVLVLGNHDDPAMPTWRPSFLHAPYMEALGFRIACFDGCLSDGRNGVGMTQREYARLASTIPECDLILAHAAPYGIEERDDLTHQGVAAIRTLIERDAPIACLYGHLHEHRVDLIGRTPCRCVYGSEIVTIERRRRNVS